MAEELRPFARDSTRNRLAFSPRTRPETILSRIPKVRVGQTTLRTTHRIAQEANPARRSFSLVGCGQTAGNARYSIRRFVDTDQEEKIAFKEGEIMVINDAALAI